MMLVNYLQTQMLLPNYQDKCLVRKSDLGIAINFNDYFHNERLTENETKRLKNMLNEQNLLELELYLLRASEEKKVTNTFKIDTWINENADSKKLALE